MSRDECRKYLRFLELDAYAKMVSALRAQGPLTEGKQKLLGDLATALHISNERHQAEIRRAVNDDKLSLIAEQIFGPNTDTEWTVEGRRIIPLFPRLKGRTAFTTFANSLSLSAAIANERQTHFPRKKEVKFKGGSHSQSKFDEKVLNHNENTFVSRKRKRSTHEVTGLNNGTYTNYPSTSHSYNNTKVSSNTKIFSASPSFREQCPATRQRVEIDKSEISHENKEFRKYPNS
ncbi:BRCA2-interacting transcriptional repressor EMSY [Nasonia vitripennis]|uniref:ENT domain-containing protein n=1 Tax=Nasonia vitripennis TaxID=7425 RepID=A0A7M7G760_NASVI|nr:BRCA2-interacting transcriptional repressor EMSY [Nasonia vitripennis]